MCIEESKPTPVGMSRRFFWLKEKFLKPFQVTTPFSKRNVDSRFIGHTVYPWLSETPSVASLVLASDPASLNYFASEHIIDYVHTTAPSPQLGILNLNWRSTAQQGHKGEPHYDHLHA